MIIAVFIICMFTGIIIIVDGIVRNKITTSIYGFLIIIALIIGAGTGDHICKQKILDGKFTIENVQVKTIVEKK